VHPAYHSLGVITQASLGPIRNAIHHEAHEGHEDKISVTIHHEAHEGQEDAV